MPSRRLISVILFFTSLLLFVTYIQFPTSKNFDEFHYVPSALQFINGVQNQNWEHPPLAKMIMALGIAIGGDRPFGWRVMSAVFGALTLVGMFWWALAVIRPKDGGADRATEIALWVALLSLFNQLLYVQSRIGMLDTFMFGFLVWALAFFCSCWKTSITRQTLQRRMAISGALFGFSIACKWFALIPLLLCIALVAIVLLFQSWGVKFEARKSATDDWYLPDLWKGNSVMSWSLWLIAIPAVCYFLTFIPLLMIQKPANPFLEFFEMQTRMYDGQLRVVNSHPYMSHWVGWAWMERPIWYAFERIDAAGQWARGVILLGNPLVMWSGLLAIAACIWGFVVKRDRAAFLIVAFYAAFYLSWAAVPRKVAFYYYYYPAGMLLSLALAWVFDRVITARAARYVYLAAAFALFCWFFPILSALPIPAESFRKWMWFVRWI